MADDDVTPTVEDVIAVGQTWRSLKGNRVVRVDRYIPEWDDCTVRNLSNGRRFAIYGDYLRRRYELVEDPS